MQVQSQTLPTPNLAKHIRQVTPMTPLWRLNAFWIAINISFGWLPIVQPRRRERSMIISMICFRHMQMQFQKNGRLHDGGNNTYLLSNRRCPNTANTPPIYADDALPKATLVPTSPLCISQQIRIARRYKGMLAMFTA
jgi:hypothetical protein